MFRNKHQQGNVLVIVLFVIIVMGYLAASLMRVTWSNQSGLTREFLGTKAWFTAQSSNEWLLTKFYPLGLSSAVSASCAAISSGSVTVPSSLIDPTCKSTLKCKSVGQLPDTNSGKDVSLYVVRSLAVCGSGLSQVERQQEIWVRE
ncbi:TPA: MSHA biogenesis protein MshP [Vibrio parahaemolyticus]|uniref:MSHA biogenesis protein MshP n=1 Tax=Vibrio diabolicus TaxID=50719 RepID=UPI0029879A69|nr:MSHA biogenesis protein MshP [Vibrio parahaemolyticus]